MYKKTVARQIARGKAIKRLEKENASLLKDLSETIRQRNEALSEINLYKKLPILSYNHIQTLFIAVEKISEAMAHVIADLKRRT